MATRLSNVLVAHPSLGVKTLKELLDKAKAEPGKLAYGSGGVGTSLHLAGELFKLMAGVDIVHVPYKGSGPVVSDLVSGQLLLAFADTAVMEHVRSGRLIALGQTAGERLEQIKDVPTISEAGVPGYNAANWQGFFLPAGTPAPIVERLHKELTAVLNLDEVKARIEALGMAPTTSTPEQFATFIADDIKLWAGVIERAGITTGQ
jgi:tripartite-type tricarboxylate transporter receptor subunit TctC